MRDTPLNVKQWFVEPTPKQFFCISLIYAVVFPVIGVFVASPVMSSFMMLAFIFFAFGTMKYSKPIVPRQHCYTNLIGFIPCLIILMFFLHSGVSFTEIIEDERRLERIRGAIPNEPFNQRVGKNSSSSLLINQIELHCKHNENDNCSRIYDYSGQIADILYQPDTWVGNIVYEISVNNKKVYRYEDQRAYFKLEQRTSRRQWFWTFMLFGIPSYWFYKHDKRLRKATPKISIEKEQMLKKSQELATNEAGYAGALGILLFLTVAIGAALTGIIQFATHKFGFSVLCFGLAGICWYVMVILSKPSSEL